MNANPVRLPLALPPKKFGLSASNSVEKTVVEVHRSDVVCENEHQNKELGSVEAVDCVEARKSADGMTAGSTATESLELANNSEPVEFIHSVEVASRTGTGVSEETSLTTESVDSAATVDITDSSEPKTVPKRATLAKMESDDDEMYILEHSEKLLKDIAEALPNYDQDDILSPTESAFTQNGTFVEETKEETSGRGELETKDLFGDDVVNAAQTKDVDDKEDSSNEEEPLLKDSQSSSPRNDQFDQFYMNVDHTAITKDYVGLPDCPNSPESPLIRQEAIFCKTHEYMNIGVPMPSDALREYINVSTFPTPPLPPKFKYKNVIL